MTQIVFGSPEAKEIIKKDQKIAEEEARKKAGPLREWHITASGMCTWEYTVHARTEEEAEEKYCDEDWESEGYPEPDEWGSRELDTIEKGKVVDGQD